MKTIIITILTIIVIGLMYIQIGLYIQIHQCLKLKQSNQTCVVKTDPVDNNTIMIYKHNKR